MQGAASHAHQSAGWGDAHNAPEQQWSTSLWRCEHPPLPARGLRAHAALHHLRHCEPIFLPLPPRWQPQNPVCDSYTAVRSFAAPSCLLGTRRVDALPELACVHICPRHASPTSFMLLSHSGTQHALTSVVSPFVIVPIRTLLAALTPVPPTTFDNYPVKSSGLGFEGYLRGSLDIMKPRISAMFSRRS